MKATQSKPLIWVVMILQALPIPLSLITILGSLISLANIGMTAEQYGPWVTACAVATMLLAGTYVIPYVVSVVVTSVRRRLGWVSFLPVLHILLTAVFCVMWVMSEGM